MAGILEKGMAEKAEKPHNRSTKKKKKKGGALLCESQAQNGLPSDTVSARRKSRVFWALMTCEQCMKMTTEVVILISTVHLWKLELFSQQKHSIHS